MHEPAATRPNAAPAPVPGRVPADGTPVLPSAAQWGRDLTAACVVGLSALSFYISTATLLFQGTLAPHVATAIGAALLGGAVLGFLFAARGSLPLTSVGAEPATVPVLAAITAGVASGATPSGALATALAALALTALATGLVWWLIGRAHRGDLIRFIPYPVIGGFIGAVGWLMVTGGLAVAAVEAFNVSHLLQWLGGSAAAPRVLTAASLGGLIWWVVQRVKHPLTLPCLIVGAVLAVHGGFALAGMSLADARAQGWLLAPFSRTLPQWPAAPHLLQAIEWGVVAQQVPLMLSAVIVGTLGLLLSETSLEVAWDAKADIDRDLRVLGLGNLVAAPLGGLVGGISISRSLLNHAAGAVTRVSGAVLSALCLVAMVAAGPVIALVPRPLLGALLIFLGIGMLKTWLLDGRRLLPARDHLVVVGMVAVTAVSGFLAAVSVGVLACCLSFAMSSARLAAVRRQVTRSAWPSRSERSDEQARYLQGHGQRQVIVELQGVLFFGSAMQLMRRVEALLRGPAPPTQLLLDFRHVQWIDSSASQALGRLIKLARREHVDVALSSLSAPARAALRATGALKDDTGPPVHADIDAAVALWDEATLRDADLPGTEFDTWLRQVLPADVDARQVLDSFERLTLAPGQLLFAQGDASDALYLVHSGRLLVSVSVPDGSGDGAPRHEQTVRTIFPGGNVGEMGLFRGVPRSASIRADGPAVVLRLQRSRLDALEREAPALAAALYRVFLRQLAGRVDQLTAQANELAR